MHRIDDTDILAFIEKTESFYPADANLATAQENRRFYDAMCAAFRQPRPQQIMVTDSQIERVAIRTYQPKHTACDTQILYLHGGGFVVGSLDSHDDICAEIAHHCELTLTSVDYRLAPEHPFPAQLDDAMIVYQMLARSSNHIIVMGDSAGGHLSAGLCLRLRRLNQQMPDGQVLVYPGLGGDLCLPSYQENAYAPLLRTQDILAYRLIANEKNLHETIEQEACPLKAYDFSALPPSYVFTADIDPLRDDGRLYVERLKEAGVAAWWRNDAQLVHGYLRGRCMSRRIKAAFDAICAGITNLALRQTISQTGNFQK